ncbi:sulfurtransferase complex subunit TusD [Glaciecola siphonariae]|uniref:Sulfurtransferase complex subunit TusD n=1 Tax=Glaciecola siphonariae TaxID=521012 RepID=A0ABV9LUP6_9ALTE
MPQSFTLFVSKSPYDSRNAESAYAFCVAALAAGHRIKHIFFYQSGVNNASSLLSTNTDEVSMKQNWQSIKQHYNVPLYVCVTAGARRGIDIDKQINVADGFEMVGMSEYFAALHNSAIKSIQF